MAFGPGPRVSGQGRVPGGGPIDRGPGAYRYGGPYGDARVPPERVGAELLLGKLLGALLGYRRAALPA